MKTLKVLIGAPLLCVASLSFAASVDTSGIGLSGNIPLDNPPFISRTWTAVNTWPTTGITNAGQIVLTNVVISIQPDQGVGMTFTAGSQTSGAVATNNCAFYGDVSYDGGRTFSTTRPISSTFTPGNSNAPYRPTFFIPYTNFAGAQIFRLTAFSNTVPAGATSHAKLWVTNVTLSTRKPPEWGR